MNTIERRQLLDAATTQELLNELSHRWLSIHASGIASGTKRDEQSPNNILSVILTFRSCFLYTVADCPLAFGQLATV